MIIPIINGVGNAAISFCTATGRFMLFFFHTVKTMFFSRLQPSRILDQMVRIGIHSLLITVITGGFAGAVLAYQSFDGFHTFGGEGLLGSVVALSMIRELGPVFTGLMVAGRAGSLIAAEIGTMRITEQIDALRTLGINPFRYLIIPRIIGATIIMPFLTLFAMIAGIAGGYLVSVHALGLTPEAYTSHIKEITDPFDIIGGLIKAGVFGLILSWVGCYKGYFTSGGARGVGMATTQSVVVGSILIIIANYFLAMLLFGI